jgi:hypothetical protein
LVQYGIALEKFCQYNEDKYDTKPSEEAYQDALSRRLIKALNVNRTINDVKSALVDGYPVAASFTLCPSFKDANNGFIPMPSEQEITEMFSDDTPKDKHFRHAMVITGFSDKLQMFVGRNSWGDDWGEKGYCYIPYTYIENEKLCDFCCIITEIDSLSVVRMEHIPALKIDDTDLNIRYFITKTSLDKEIAEVENNKKQRDYLRLYFEKIKKVLSSPNDRDTFITQSKEKLREEQEEIKKAKQAKQKEQDEELEKFNHYKQYTIIKTIGFVITFAFLFFLGNETIKAIGCWLSPTCELCVNWWLVISAVVLIAGIVYYRKILPKTAVIAIGVVLLFFGFPLILNNFGVIANSGYSVSYLWLIPVYAVLAGFVYYKSNKRWKEWRDKRDELEDKIQKLNKEIAGKEKEINNFKIKTFAAWTLLKSLEKTQIHFQLLYGNFISLINNLRTWYKKVADSKENIELETITPNASLLNKEVLDKFFEDKLKGNKMFEIDLSDGIEKHTVTEDYLKAYREKLFNKITKNLLSCSALSEFDISAHIVDNSFSEIAKEVTRNLIDDIDNKSDLFLRISSNERGEIIRSTGIYVPSLNIFRDNLRRKIGKYSEPYFESNDKCRLVFIKTATLWFKECVNLKYE